MQIPHCKYSGPMCTAAAAAAATMANRGGRAGGAFNVMSIRKVPGVVFSEFNLNVEGEASTLNEAFVRRSKSFGKL